MRVILLISRQWLCKCLVVSLFVVSEEDMSFADFRSKMSKFPEAQNGFDSGKRSCSNLNQTRTKVTGGGHF